MKYTIEGFQQSKLLEWGLDAIDAIILRYVFDFQPSPKLYRETFDGKEYFWIKYSALIEAVPIIGIENKQVIARRFQKYVDCGLMEKHLKKQGGTFTLFRLTERQDELKEYSTQNSRQLKSQPLLTQKSTPIDSKVDTKDSSNKDSSNKEIINTGFLKESIETTEETEKKEKLLEPAHDLYQQIIELKNIGGLQEGFVYDDTTESNLRTLVGHAEIGLAGCLKAAENLCNCTWPEKDNWGLNGMFNGVDSIRHVKEWMKRKIPKPIDEDDQSTWARTPDIVFPDKET